MSSSTYERIFQTVQNIPSGKVATYGQIAYRARASGPRQVGYALHHLPQGSSVPWHRVINSKGEISLPAGSELHEIQKTLLEAEGIEFSPEGKISRSKYLWEHKLPKPRPYSE